MTHDRSLISPHLRSAVYWGAGRRQSLAEPRWVGSTVTSLLVIRRMAMAEKHTRFMYKGGAGTHNEDGPPWSGHTSAG